ncbi:prolyl oligopeptidase family serine peptidase [bacterium]|nr:prolyl oligopeptidase family serine peptidase [bacterium]
MSRSRLLAALLAAATLTTLPLTAAAEGEAATDSTYFTMEAEGASVGWLSLAKTKLADGNMRYHGGGILQSTTKLRWELDLTGDLTRLLSFRSVLTMPDQEVVTSSVFKEGGGEPEMSVKTKDYDYSPETEKVHASAVFVPRMIVPTLAPLSDRLAGEDPKSLDINLHATNGAQSLGLRVEGKPNARVTVRGEETPVRTFLLTITHADLPEPMELTLYQRPDGTFYGVETGGMTMFATGGGADAPPQETYVSSGISFAGGDSTLAGTVAMPVVAEDEAAPAAAILMLSGPSRVGRHGNDTGFAFFAHLAQGLAEAGVVSLRYDRRSLDEAGPGCMSLLAADAHAALQALRERPEVDPAKVLLLGHGEGAMLLGEVAALAESAGAPVAGLVFLGGVTVKVADLHAAVPRPADASWLASFLDYDPRAALQGVTLPMLLLHGALDAEVPSDNATGLKTFMNEAGHMKVSCTVGKKMNHYLQSAETGEIAEYEGLAPACAKGIVKRIASFAGMCAR